MADQAIEEAIALSLQGAGEGQPVAAADGQRMDNAASAGSTEHHQGHVYHERQEAALCAMHCINNLLQAPCCTVAQLSDIAEELDNLEKIAMAESGIEGADFLKFVAQDSNNVDEAGNFSIQVIKNSLERLSGLSCIPLDSPDMKEIKADPLRAEAFICNHSSHWIALRRLHGTWYDLNSLNERPTLLSDMYLGMYLQQLSLEGYTVFVTPGTLPAPSNPDANSWVAHRSAKYWTEQELKGAVDNINEQAIEEAIALSLQGDGEAPASVADCNVNETNADAQELAGMFGLSVEQAQFALEATSGDKEQAANLLLQ